jgi:hypothetical protein
MVGGIGRTLDNVFCNKELLDGCGIYLWFYFFWCIRHSDKTLMG